MPRTFRDPELLGWNTVLAVIHPGTVQVQVDFVLHTAYLLPSRLHQAAYHLQSGQLGVQCR